MGVKIEHNIPEVVSRLKNYEKKMTDELVVALVEAGKKIIEIAKDSHTYKNQTGNLEASTGFGVVIKGKLIGHGGFDDSVRGGNVGLNKLEQLVSKVGSNESAIIVVAGMDYAAYVERCGYLILDEARFKGDTILSGLLNNIKIEI